MSGRTAAIEGGKIIVSSVEVSFEMGTNSGAVARRSEAKLEGTDMSLGVGFRGVGKYCLLLPRTGELSAVVSSGWLGFVAASSFRVSIWHALAIEGQVVVQLYCSGTLPVNPDFFRLYSTAESTVAGSQKDVAFGVAFTVEVLVARDAPGQGPSSYTDMFLNVALMVSSS
jgi:hypothetical protein